jgi:hypothetical protein
MFLKGFAVHPGHFRRGLLVRFPEQLITASFYIIINNYYGEDKWPKSVANGEARGFLGVESSRNSVTRQRNTKFVHTTRHEVANQSVAHLESNTFFKRNCGIF